MDDAIVDVMLLQVVAVGGEDDMDLLLRDVVVEVKVVCLDDVEVDGESKMEKEEKSLGGGSEDICMYVCSQDRVQVSWCVFWRRGASPRTVIQIRRALYWMWSDGRWSSNIALHVPICLSSSVSWRPFKAVKVQYTIE